MKHLLLLLTTLLSALCATAQTTDVADFFSQTYGQKWVRINSARQGKTGLAWGLGAKPEAGQTPTFLSSMNVEKQLWCLVGTPERFKIYHRLGGEDLALTSATPARDVPATLTQAGQAREWKLTSDYLSKHGGLTIKPATGTTNQALNLWGNVAGNPLKYWDADDAGSVWALTLVAESDIVAPPYVEEHGTVLFQSVGSPHPYRIPAIVKTQSGHLIAASDYRYCGGDVGYGRVDIVARTSRDNGATWEPSRLLAQGDGGSTTTCGFGDAILAADRESGRVLLGYVGAPSGGNCWTDKPDYYFQLSTDEGETWAPRYSVMASLKEQAAAAGIPCKNFFFGSGKVAQSHRIKVGDFYRLYSAVWALKQAGGVINFVVYSDDFGQTWTLLGGAPAATGGCDEPKAEELPNGNVALSSRRAQGRCFNIFTYTDRAAATGSWAAAVGSPSVSGGLTTGDSGTNGELLILYCTDPQGRVVPIALQSVPNNGRTRVAIWTKVLASAADYDTPTHLAQGWTHALELTPASSAYSTMCLQQDGRVAFYFEDGTGGGGYDMSYVPLTLEDLGLGDYRLAENGQVEEVNITYQVLSETGEPLWSQTVPGLKGAAYPAVSAPESLTQGNPWLSLSAVPEGVCEADETVTLTLGRSAAAPQCAATAEQVDHWYAMDVHGNEALYPLYAGAGGKVMVEYKNYVNGDDITHGAAKGEHYAWGFVGDPLGQDGVRLLNKQTGLYLYWPGTDLGADATLAEQGTTFVVRPVSSGVAGGFALQPKGKTCYLNHRATVLKGWTDNDGGSTFRVYELKMGGLGRAFSPATGGEWDARVIPFYADIPQGLKVYSCAALSGQVLTLTPEEGLIKPGVPYLLHCESPCSIKPLAGTGNYYDLVTVGLLTGVSQWSYTTPDKHTTEAYRLQTLQTAGGQDVQVFQRAKEPVSDGQVYIASSVSTEPILYLSQEDRDLLTALSLPAAAPSAEPAPIYDLSGRRLRQLQRGVNIVGGRKVVVR